MDLTMTDVSATGPHEKEADVSITLHHGPDYSSHGTLRRDGPGPAKSANLPYDTLQTGLVYDVRMRFHVEAVPVEQDVHPEDPRRIYAIFEAFVQSGLAWRQGCSEPTDYYMGRIDTRLVTKDEVCLVHTEKHWDWVQSLSSKSAEELVDELQHPGESMDSVYLSPSTPYCASLSAGGAIEACRAIMLGKVKNAFAVIRPPGHHAEREDAKGFCFFDNCSIATKVCQQEFGERCRKVLILDWDVHHGNGIQQATYDDPNVLYISLHVHRDGNFYPERSYRDKRPAYGDHLHCGDGRGLGYNVNIPWRNHGMGDADYIYAFQQVVMPIAIEFDPDLIIVAAGFDAAEGDMLGGCHVTPAGYAHMTHMLMSLADGKVAICLEGGYNLDSIARSSCAVARTLMGEPPDRLENMVPTKSGVDDVRLVVRQQSRFWVSLYPKDVGSQLSRVSDDTSERLHDVVRRWQAETYWSDFEMSPLFIHHEFLSKSFENQVLARYVKGEKWSEHVQSDAWQSLNYMEARPLLVFLREPPQMLASPDPRTGNVELHNTWLVRQNTYAIERVAANNSQTKTDSVKTYISWALDQGFAVLDVNLPKHITHDGAPFRHENADTHEARVNQATQLLTYLWENYIELNDATHIFLVGVNVGHGAIVNFIRANEDRATARITRAISFIEDVPLQSCKSATNDALPSWYWAASLVFISEEHNFWTSEYARKVKKRFGRVRKSAATATSDMIAAHRQDVLDTLLEATEDWRTSQPQPVVSDGDLDIIEAVEEVAKSRLPPLANFALSPKKPASTTASPGRRFVSPHLTSPQKVLANLTTSSQPASPRAPRSE